MAEGSAVCQDKWVEPQKRKVGVGNGYNSLFLKHLTKYRALASFLPIPVVFSPLSFDSPPWGLRWGEKKISVLY